MFYTPQVWTSHKKCSLKRNRRRLDRSLVLDGAAEEGAAGEARDGAVVDVLGRRLTANFALLRRRDQRVRGRRVASRHRDQFPVGRRIVAWWRVKRFVICSSCVACVSSIMHDACRCSNMPCILNRLALSFATLPFAIVVCFSAVP